MIFLTLTDQFQNLRRIEVFEAATFDEELVLPNLEMYDIYEDDPLYANSTALKSVNLPNLRRLSIAHSTEVESFGHLYDSIVPQLDHIYLANLMTGDLDHILRLTTSLQSLRILCHNINRYGEIPGLRDQLVHVDVKKLRYDQCTLFEGEDWERGFSAIKDLKEVLDKKDNLNGVHLCFSYHCSEISQDAGDQSLAWWQEIKEEMRLICVRKGVEVLNLTASIYVGGTRGTIWRA